MLFDVNALAREGPAGVIKAVFFFVEGLVDGEGIGDGRKSHARRPNHAGLLIAGYLSLLREQSFKSACKSTRPEKKSTGRTPANTTQVRKGGKEGRMALSEEC